MQRLRIPFLLVCPAILSALAAPRGAEAAGKALSPKELFTKVSPAVVKVVVLTAEGKPRSCGTGFLVASTGLVVTNYHVIDEAGTTESLRIEVKGKPRKVRGLHGFLPKHDLALLAMETKRGEALPFLMLAQGLPDQGEKAYAVGYPLGLPNATITDGLINGFQKLHGIRFIQTSAPISEGSSGGPLLLPDATVAGVTTLTLAEGQNLNFAVPAEHVRGLLHSAAGEVRKDIPRLLRPQMFKGIPRADKPIHLLRPANLKDTAAAMTLPRLYAGIVQAHIDAGVARPNLSDKEREQAYQQLVRRVRDEKIIARRVLCDVQAVRLAPGRDRTRNIRFIAQYVARNNARKDAAAFGRAARDPARYSVQVVCKSPYWPGTLTVYVDKADARKLAAAKPGRLLRVSGFLSEWWLTRWWKADDETMRLVISLDGCVVEGAAPVPRKPPKRS